MSLFLKITEKSNGKYLQIYDSFREKKTKKIISSCVKTLGYEQELIDSGIDDPISFYRKYCKEENERKKEEKKHLKDALVSDEIKEFYLGNILVEVFFNSNLFKNFFSMRSTLYPRKIDYFSILQDLISARMIDSCSKLKTYNDVIPHFYRKREYSLDDIYDCLDAIGEDYQNLIEIFNHALKKIYSFETDLSLFDCTNFYFEIDKEDELRRKGPSKENRKEPIVGMGLLLDKNCLPIDMKIYPGNKSEKPVQREILKELKEKDMIQGRTIIVADKGLNCAENIYDMLKNGDGYIYSKSVANLSHIEKEWVLLDDPKHPESAYDHTLENGEVVYKIKSRVDDFTYSFKEKTTKKKIEFTVTEKRVVFFNKGLKDKTERELLKMRDKVGDLILSKAKKEEYGPYSSYVIIKSKTGDDIEVKINEDKFFEELKFAGYNLIVTSEIKEKPQTICDTYHQLWRIEESFRIMKTDLNTRPVYLQKHNRIYGHFLICYLALAILRLYQFVYLKNEYKSSELFDFIQSFKAFKVEDNYLNMNIVKRITDGLNKLFAIPLNKAIYDTKTLDKLFSSKLKSTTF